MDNKFTSIASGRKVTLKSEVFDTLVAVAPKVYRSAKGNLYTTAKMPGLRTLERYADDGVAKTPCGCRTEPDAGCSHGVPNWLMVVGVI